MSIAPDQLPCLGFVGCPPSPKGSKPNRALHRIAEVRREQGVSLRSAARNLGTDISTARQQEEATTDLTLSQLIRWQKVLDVPLADLLVEPGTTLSQPVMERARMVRLMKTAAAIHEQTESTGVRRLATMLVEQLIEIMPELASVSAWHSVGQRRSLNEYGRVVERCIREDFFLAHHDE